jgi:hypothetical protein
MLSAIEARHLALFRGGEDTSYGLDYWLAPLQTWASVGSVEVRLRVPGDWRADALLQNQDGSQGSLETGSEGDFQLLRADLSGTVPARLIADLTLPASPFAHGGPLVGFGSVDDLNTFGMRFGYEFAAPRDVIWGLDADTDFEDYWVLAPRALVATPFFFGPSIGLGLGVPVMLSPETTVGGRLELVMGLGPLSFIGDLDVFPGSDGEVVRWTLLGGLSF